MNCKIIYISDKVSIYQNYKTPLDSKIIFMKLISLFFIIFYKSLSISLDLVSPEIYYKESPSLERKTIINYLVNQFKNKSASQNQLDKIWNDKQIRNNVNLMRIQIIDQKLYVSKGNLEDSSYRDFISFFKKLIKTYRINNLDLIITIQEKIFFNHNISDNFCDLPIFMMAKNLNSKYERTKFLLPDAHMILPNWKKIFSNIKETNNNINWKDKVNKIFWRGASTGGPLNNQVDNYNLENIHSLHRLKLVLFSKLYPNLIDAQFSAYYHFTTDDGGKKLKEAMKIIFPNKNKYVNQEEHLIYKYLISIDGHTTSWHRVPWILLSNSVLLKQETNVINWYYPALKPYVHYIPLKEDLSDIFSQIEWAKNNDDQVLTISLNGQKFAGENLSPKDIEIQTVLILNEYSKLFSQESLAPTLIKADEVITLTEALLFIVKQLKNRLINFFN